MTPPTPTQQILHAYRHLSKTTLHAIQYSKPARYTARARLRHAFRHNPRSHYSAPRVARTLEFLEAAARARGIEHRIVKNLMHVWWERGKRQAAQGGGRRKFGGVEAYGEFERTVGLLEESMGLCFG